VAADLSSLKHLRARLSAPFLISEEGQNLNLGSRTKREVPAPVKSSCS
jgi:hypothetical protein